MPRLTPVRVAVTILPLLLVASLLVPVPQPAPGIAGSSGAGRGGGGRLAPMPQPAPGIAAASRDPAPVLRLSASRIFQGGAVGITLLGAPAGGALRVRFSGRLWPLYRSGGTAATYIGTDPFTRPGPHRIVVEHVAAGSVRAIVSGIVTVSAAAFATRRLRLDPPTEALFDPKLVAIERRKAGAAFSRISPRKLWDGPFALPTDAPRSSPYGVRSVYNGVMRGWHRGADFAAPAGSPVRAAHHGIVRLAEHLPLSGNAVLIDHGLGVFTTYMHLSSVAVRPGQRVRRGDVVGAVGSSGVATGPHLHWGLRVNGLYVDPLRWVADQP